jgi:thiol-disulfide isomerase/thioredoxin
MNITKFLLILLIPLSQVDGQEISTVEELNGEPELLNKSAPNFESMTLSNKPFELLDFKGKTILLHFWSLRCADCFMELADLNKIAKTYSDKNVVVISIIDDDREKLLRVIEVRSFRTYRFKSNLYSKSEINFQIIPDRDKEILTSYSKEKNFSQTFFINKYGIVKDYFGGYLATHTGEEEVKNIDHLTAKIDKILNDTYEN